MEYEIWGTATISTIVEAKDDNQAEELGLKKMKEELKHVDLIAEDINITDIGEW